MNKLNCDVICIICARGGSKGLADKNLRLLDGEALVARAVKHAFESNSIGSVIVSTDSIQIADVAKKAGAEIPFLRPSEIANDLTTTEVTLQHALNEYEQLSNKKFSIGVFLTATDIFRNPSWITQAIFKLRSNPDLDSVFVGYPTHKNYWEQLETGEWIRLRDWMSTYSSRQIRKYIVREDTGLACASRAELWRQGRRIGDKVDIILNEDSFSSIDIHSIEDLKLAEAALALRKAYGK